MVRRAISAANADLETGGLIPALFIGVVLALIFKEPDVGNALLLATVSGMMLLIAGSSPEVFPAAGHRRGNRGRCFHLLQSHALRIEFTRGCMSRRPSRTRVTRRTRRWWRSAVVASPARGLGDSRQKLGFLPEQHTDFIFSIIGEELGLIATLLVIVAFVAIVSCGTYIAVNSADMFGTLLGSGITLLIGLQALINIGVVTSALPNKGLPLPFISYGGSNLVIMLLSVGVLLSIARQARETDGVMRSRATQGDVANPFARRTRTSTMTPSPHPSVRVAIACGGTGGHLFPGLAVADQLMRRGCAVMLLISPKDVDQQAVRGVSGMEVVTLPAVGLERGGEIAFVRGFIQSYRAAAKLFKSRPPQAALAMGGFTSAPPILAARRAGARTFLHESNTIPGRANRWLSRVVRRAFVGFPTAAVRLHNRNVTVTGTPVRPCFQAREAGACRAALGLDPARPVLLVMGGSQGASGHQRAGVAIPAAARQPRARFAVDPSDRSH